MNWLGISEWGEVQSIFKVLIMFCPHVLDFSVIDRTPPPLFGVADGEMGRSSDKRGAPVTPFTLVWGQISWADFQCSFFGTWILLICIFPTFTLLWGHISWAEQKSSPLPPNDPIYLFAWCQKANSALNTSFFFDDHRKAFQHISFYFLV